MFTCVKILRSIIKKNACQTRQNPNAHTLFSQSFKNSLISLSLIFLKAQRKSEPTGTITPMFSSYDRIKPNLKQKAATARGKWLVRKGWGKLRGVKSLFLSENMHEK